MMGPQMKETEHRAMIGGTKEKDRRYRESEIEEMEFSKMRSALPLLTCKESIRMADKQ